jgi:glycosyltransferase involved in cell wall biosynthesis
MHIKGLHARGHQIHVFTTTESNREYLPLGPYSESEIFLPLPGQPVKQSLKQRITKNLRSKNAEARISRLNQLKQLAFECSQRIEAGNFDILFANSCQYTYNSPIGTCTNIPSVSYLQEPYRPLYEASPRLPWLLPEAATAHPNNPIKRALERSRELHQNHAFRLQATEELKWAKAFNRILCNSQFSRESILRAYNLESKVCYLGIDSEAFRPCSNEKERFVIGVGSAHYTKRLEAAIIAVATIPKQIRPPLLWIGNFADNDYAKSMHELAISHDVEFKHRILLSDFELQSAMSQAACFLYTSHLEPFGLTPLEANACGTAVVAISEGGVRETIVDGVNGFVSLDNDPQALGQLVARLTENLDFAKIVGDQSRAHVIKHWSVNAAIDRIEQHLIDIAR